MARPLQAGCPPRAGWPPTRLAPTRGARRPPRRRCSGAVGRRGQRDDRRELRGLGQEDQIEQASPATSTVQPLGYQELGPAAAAAPDRAAEEDRRRCPRPAPSPAAARCTCRASAGGTGRAARGLRPGEYDQVDKIDYEGAPRAEEACAASPPAASSRPRPTREPPASRSATAFASRARAACARRAVVGIADSFDAGGRTIQMSLGTMPASTASAPTRSSSCAPASPERRRRSARRVDALLAASTRTSRRLATPSSRRSPGRRHQPAVRVLQRDRRDRRDRRRARHRQHAHDVGARAHARDRRAARSAPRAGRCRCSGPAHHARRHPRRGRVRRGDRLVVDARARRGLRHRLPLPERHDDRRRHRRRRPRDARRGPSRAARRPARRPRRTQVRGGPP